MKVAISFPECHCRGGVERVMVECANFLAARGHHVQVVASNIDSHVTDGRVATLRVSDLRLPAGLNLAAFQWKAERVLRSSGSRPDVLAGFGVSAPNGSVVWMTSVHAQWLRLSSKLSHLLARWKRRCNPFHYVVIRMERRLLERRRYKALIVLSEAEKRALHRLYGVPEDDMTILPNGYSARDFNLETSLGKRDEMRQSFGYTDKDKVVVFVANEVERKGLPQLLAAVAKLNDSHVKVLVAGRLNQTWIDQAVGRFGLEGQVRSVGSSSNVALLHAAGDVFALPTFYEAWGLVIVEALACGLPVLTSKCAGASIAVHEGISGSLLDNPLDVEQISQRLRKLLDGEHAARETISESIREYQWERVLLRYEAILKAHALPLLSR